MLQFQKFLISIIKNLFWKFWKGIYASAEGLLQALCLEITPDTAQVIICGAGYLTRLVACTVSSTQNFILFLKDTNICGVEGVGWRYFNGLDRCLRAQPILIFK